MDAITLGRRLRRARMAAGLSQVEVAEQLGIPRPAVSLLESGRRSVSSIELATLARLYGKSVDSLVAESGGEHILGYFRADAPVDDADRVVLGEAVEWCRTYARVEEAAFGDQRYEVPVYPIPHGRAIDQGDYLANQERRRLGLGSGPIPSIVDLLEHQGVKVLMCSFPHESHVSGCYFFSPELGPCVVINVNDEPSRRRFTGAHEYAHFLVERGDHPGDVCVLSRKREFAEMRANAFSASFLLPDAGIVGFLADLGVQPGDVRAEHVVHLMHRFEASYSAALWRLLNLGWISEERRSLLAGASSTALSRVLGYAGREPGAAEPDPDRYRAVAVEAWRAGRLAVSELAELVKIPERELLATLSGLERMHPSRPPNPAAEPDWL